MHNEGLLIVLSGPSGAGKGTVVKALLEQQPGIRLLDFCHDPLPERRGRAWEALFFSKKRGVPAAN